MYVDDSEELSRKNVYIENKSKIDEHNYMYENGQRTYKMAINHFADMVCLLVSVEIHFMYIANSF